MRSRDHKQKLRTWQKVTIWLLNLALIAAAGFLTRALVRRHVVNSSDTAGDLATTEYLTTGARFPVLRIDWAQNNKTLVLMLQKGCGACEDSASFYRGIKQALSARNDVSIVAILSDSLDEAAAYLNKIDIPVNDIRQISLPSLRPYGLMATPTLVLVNENGLVTGIWSGKLPRKREAEVLSMLNISAVSSNDNASEPVLERIDESRLQHLIDTRQHPVLVDLRGREAYAQAHLPGSKNIPYDELNVRALDELSPSGLIVLYSGSYGDDLDENAAIILNREGFTRVMALHSDDGYVAPAPQ